MRLRWKRSFRIIASRYPPIEVFERVASPDEWELLYELESRTNPRLRNEAGDIRLVPKEQRVNGPGASWLMASFTHIGRPSRFSDGSYGVYYAAERLRTAIAETVYHFERFWLATQEEPLDSDFRVLVARVNHRFHNLGGRRFQSLLHPTDYLPSQAFAKTLRTKNSPGVVYPSVRGQDRCLGVFQPKAIALPTQGPHLAYHFDGTRVDRLFRYGSEKWVSVESATAGSLDGLDRPAQLQVSKASPPHP